MSSLVGTVVWRRADTARVIALDHLHSSQDSLHVAITEAFALNVIATNAEHRADSITQHAATAVRVASSLHAIAVLAEQHIPVADTAAIAAVDALTTEADSLRSANAQLSTVVGAYRSTIDSLLVSSRHLIATAARVDTAATAVVRATYIPLLARLTPKFGIGAAVGVSALTHAPDVVIGFTFGWPR